jgi:hypothetical protein
MGILARLGMAALPGQRAPFQGVRDAPPAFGRPQAEQTAEVVENLVGAKVLGKVRVLRSEADLARAMSSFGLAPNTLTLPESGLVRPTIVFTTVDLPAPLGPRSPKARPGSTANETPCTAQGSRAR